MFPYFEDKNNKIFTSHRTSSYNYDSHFHKMIEIAYCFSGFQQVKVGKIVYTLKKGDVIVIFPNIIHEYIKCETDAPTESVSLISETDFFTSLIPDLKTKRPESPFIKAELIPENAALAFRKMVSSNDKAELLGWSFIAISGILKSLNLLPTSESDGFSLAPHIISYINENFKKPLTIKYLAKEFGYSSSYIAHIFYDQLKIPFRTYLGTVRSEYAANLISSCNKSLTEISYECGYNSLNTFCRCFKKHFSCTPSEYKKKEQAK